MQSLRLNPILNTDSYKLTHWWQYPPDTLHVYSSLESRGGMFEETMLAMLQYIVKSNFAGQVFTLDDVEEARRIAHAHFSGHPKTFNYEGFRSLYAKHGGRLPLRIRAVKEGTVVKSHNALITIENTDPEFYWLTTGPKLFSCKSGIPSLLPRSPVRSNRSSAKPSPAPAISRFFPSSSTTSDSAASRPRNLPPLAAPRICSIFSAPTRLPPYRFSISFIPPISALRIRSTVPPTASLLPSIPPSPRGAKRMSSTLTPTSSQTVPKESWRASAIPTTSTMPSATSGAARCATKSCKGKARW